MYGGLQGLNKAETAEIHGEAQVKVSYLNVLETTHAQIDSEGQYYNDMALPHSGLIWVNNLDKIHVIILLYMYLNKILHIP